MTFRTMGYKSSAVINSSTCKTIRGCQLENTGPQPFPNKTCQEMRASYYTLTPRGTISNSQNQSTNFERQMQLCRVEHLQHICPHFWASLLNTIAISPKSENKFVVKVFNWSYF